MDPRFARMILESGGNGTLHDVLPIVAGMSIQDVRERPEERREEADRLHARFADPTSDFLTLLNLWNHLQEKQAELGSSAFRRLCRSEHLNYVRVREWFDVHRQVRSLAPKQKGPPRARGARPTPTPIHKAILAGLLSHIGLLDERAAASAAAGSSRGHARAAAATARSTSAPAACGSRSSPDRASRRRSRTP